MFLNKICICFLKHTFSQKIKQQMVVKRKKNRYAWGDIECSFLFEDVNVTEKSSY